LIKYVVSLRGVLPLLYSLEMLCKFAPMFVLIIIMAVRPYFVFPVEVIFIVSRNAPSI
jgi:hypothetical protein